MRILTCVVMLSALAASGWGQERTIFNGDVERSGFGGPVIRFSRIHDQSAILIGGRGGWILNHSLVLGGGGYGVISEIDAPEGALGPEEGPLDIEFGYGGFEIEYIVDSDSRAHYTVYTLIGIGATNYVKDSGSVWESNEQSGESDFLFVLEPAVTGELNVTTWFRFNLGVSYRLVNGVDQAMLDDGDFSGPAVSITLKFGKF